jgi:hypothetical protein
VRQGFVDLDWRFILYRNLYGDFRIMDFGAARSPRLFNGLTGYRKDDSDMQSAQFFYLRFVLDDNLHQARAVAQINKIQPAKQALFMQPALDHNFLANVGFHVIS